MSYLHTRSLKILSAALAIWLVAGACPYPVAAQVTESPGADKTTEQGLSDTELAALAGKLTPEERMALLARLSDGQVRELLIQQWDKAAIARADDEKSTTVHWVGGMNSRIQLIRANLGDDLAAVKNLPTVFPFAVAKLSEGREAPLLLVMLGMAIMLGVGVVAEWLFRRATLNVRHRLEQSDVDHFFARVGQVCLRFILDMLAIAVFALAAVGIFFAMWHGHEPTRHAILTYLSAILIVRFASLVSRFLLAPASPALRMVPADDANARYLHNCVVWFASLAAFGLLTCALLQFLGLDPAVHELLVAMVGLVLIVTLVTMIRHGRHGIADLIRGGPKDQATSSPAVRLFADIWHWLVIAYGVGIYGVVTIGRLAGYDIADGVGILSFLIVAAVPLIDVAIGQVLSGFVAAREQGQTVAQTNYVLVIRRGLRIVLVLLAFLMLTELWGISVFSMAESGIGARATRTILDIGFIVLIAYVGWQIAATAIDRRLAPETDEAAEHESGAEGGHGLSRVQTLLPLFRRFLQITIMVMTIMIVLSSLGVNIGPLIAGAGVVGLAIGFGAQTLVRDIVSGVFFLVDDAFRLEEYIDIGAVKGRVEKINVRSLVLRHHRGAVHTVPFGEIHHLTNYSRDWAIMKLSFRVTYDTDINKVKKIFKQIGAELMEHEELGPFFIEPFKSQGVFAMEDSAMIVKAKFMAKPGRQFQIRKELYTRVQQAFREQGIEFAHRRVTVDLPPGVDADSPEGKAMADRAAAASLTDPRADGKAPA